MTFALLGALCSAPIIVAANPVLIFDAVVDSVWGQPPVSVTAGDNALGRISYNMNGITTLDEEGCRYFRFAANPRSSFQITIKDATWVATLKGILIPQEYGAYVCADAMGFDGDAVSPIEFPGSGQMGGVISVIFVGIPPSENNLPTVAGELPFTDANGFLAGGDDLVTWWIWFHPVPPAQVPVRPTTWSNIKQLYHR